MVFHYVGLHYIPVITTYIYIFLPYESMVMQHYKRAFIMTPFPSRWSSHFFFFFFYKFTFLHHPNTPSSEKKFFLEPKIKFMVNKSCSCRKVFKVLRIFLWSRGVPKIKAENRFVIQNIFKIIFGTPSKTPSWKKNHFIISKFGH